VATAELAGRRVGPALRPVGHLGGRALDYHARVSGDPTADNPASTAFGLGQLLLGNRILYLGEDYATTDCGRQLWAFRAYVRDRYGTAERAKAFWQANGWY
jgi:hypothetical protein